MESRSPLPFVALVVAVVLALAACGGGGKKAETKAIAVTSTTKPPPPLAPLTGMPDPGGASLKRSAITVKIDNRKEGWPKYGIDQADVVYEEVVEGGYTRLAAIFNSHAPDKVGPVRSVRKTDQSLVWPIGGIFAYSGGADYAIQSINTAPVVQLDETRAGATMFRDHSRDAPFNLYAHVDQMYGRGGKPVPPPPLFTYRKPKSVVAGTPTLSVRVGFLSGFATTWTYDKTTGTWKRSIFGQAEPGPVLAPKNVVVMKVRYVGGNSQGLGAEAEIDGTGEAWVFTAGKMIHGTWSRPDKKKPALLLDAMGHQIDLTPGQTWVELPDVGYSVDVTPAPTATTSTT